MASGCCERCNNYIYDDEAECYFCKVNLDEDEMMHSLQSDRRECPYYRSDDEYAVVRKQN